MKWEESNTLKKVHMLYLMGQFFGWERNVGWWDWHDKSQYDEYDCDTGGTSSQMSNAAVLELVAGSKKTPEMCCKMVKQNLVLPRVAHSRQ